MVDIGGFVKETASRFRYISDFSIFFKVQYQQTIKIKPSLWPLIYFSLIEPFAPGDFAEKRVLKLVEWFSGHCRAIKS